MLSLSISCKKKKDEPPTSAPTAIVACELAAKLKTKWVWDSSIYDKGGSILYSYTSEALKTYSTGITDTVVETICSFSLNLTQDAANGRGCTQTYTQAPPESSAGRGIIEGITLNKYDSVYRIKKDMSWIVTQLPGNRGEYFWIELEDYFYHKGTSEVSYIIFLRGAYDIERLTEKELVILFRGSSEPKLRCYLHAEN
jgi:hypothetical protein